MLRPPKKRLFNRLSGGYSNSLAFPFSLSISLTSSKKNDFFIIELMPNKWVEALKVFNKGKTAWCIPKKGGKEYEDIQKIMNGEKTITQKAKPKEPKSKEPKTKEPKQLKVQLTMEKQIKKLNDTLANFFEINSLYSYDELSKAINTNKELKKIYNNLDADFKLYSSFNFTNVNEIQSVIDDYNIKLDKYKKILKEYYY